MSMLCVDDLLRPEDLKHEYLCPSFLEVIIQGWNCDHIVLPIGFHHYYHVLHTDWASPLENYYGSTGELTIFNFSTDGRSLKRVAELIHSIWIVHTGEAARAESEWNSTTLFVRATFFINVYQLAHEFLSPEKCLSLEQYLQKQSSIALSQSEYQTLLQGLGEIFQDNSIALKALGLRGNQRP